MKILRLLLLIGTGLVLTACEKQAPEQTATASPPATPTVTTPAPATVTPASAEAPTVATNTPSTTADGPTRYIDHDEDEAEFKLKKSLAGLESMLEALSDPEQIAAMKAEMAELQSQLDAL